MYIYIYTRVTVRVNPFLEKKINRSRRFLRIVRTRPSPHTYSLGQSKSSFADRATVSMARREAEEGTSNRS